VKRTNQHLVEININETCFYIIKGFGFIVSCVPELMKRERNVL